MALSSSRLTTITRSSLRRFPTLPYLQPSARSLEACALSRHGRAMSTSRGPPASSVKIHYVESRGDYQHDARSPHPILRKRPDHAAGLYEHQSTLPRLPVPSLTENLLPKLLATALPLATCESEAQNFRDACQRFATQARPLQKRLEERRDGPAADDSSWLQHWWNQLGYLQVRDSVMIHVSYFFRMDPYVQAQSVHASSTEAPLLRRGARLLQRTALFAQEIRQGTLAPELLGTKNPTPLCSSQYKYLLASCRIPQPDEDVYRLYSTNQGEEETDSLPRHAIVACRGHFYSIPVLGTNGKPLSIARLTKLLEECRHEARNQAPGAGLADMGFLTATHRDVWTKAYADLVRLPSLASSLEVLQSGICLLALDDYDADLSNGDTVSESARALWHGNVGQTSNRWWDKSIQWIISEDYCGLVGEHSLVDGMPALNLSRYCFDNSQRVEDEDDDCSLHDEQHLVATPVFQHVWDRLSESDRDGIQYHIKRAKDEVINQIGDYDLEVLEYKRYGTKRLRESTFQPSADAWAQMAMQWASTLILGEGSSRPVATYESVQTRRFLHGRTATTRSVSSASAAWVQSMIQGQDSLSRQQELLQRALESHVQYTRQASAAEGIDRHLFGLQMLVGADEAVPDLFQDPLYMRSKRWRLSTSTLPGSAPGFGPVQADGVGIGYDLSLDDIWNFTITARQEHQWVQPMRKQLSECLDSMEVFLEDTVFPQSRM